MTETDLQERVGALPLYRQFVDRTLPALSGAPELARFELRLVGWSDDAKASTVLVVLSCPALGAVAVVWVPTTALRGDPQAEISAHVYPREHVVVSTSVRLHDGGGKADLILVLPDGQTASGFREVRVAVPDPSEVGRAARALQG
jgi:hypothetical protein